MTNPALMPRGTDFISAAFAAMTINNACNVAYWREAMHECDVSHHHHEAREALRHIADLFGYLLVEKIPEVSAEDRGRAAAANARVMNAELPPEQLEVLKLKGMVS